MSARPSPALSRVRDALKDTLPHARLAALDRVCTLGLPTPRDDAFRYSGLRLLDRRALAPQPTVGVVPTELPVGPYRLVTHNGIVDEAASALPSSLSRTVEALPVPNGDGAEERIRLLNAALGGTRTVLTLARDAEARLDIVHLGHGGGAYPAIRVVVERGARLTLCEYFAGDEDAESVTASVLDITLADGAWAEHACINVAGHRAAVIGDVRVAVGRDSRFEHRTALLGSQLMRLDVVVQLVEPGASAALNGLFLADGQREHHLRTLVRHAAPHCRSDQLYRGVANGRGRGSYDGKVAVDRGANGTASTQSSRNLLLSADAAIDTRPQLEILADAVKCSHGATTGSLDEQMLFYLLSRGLDRDTARAVLTYAFLGDVLAGFPVDVRTFVEGRALGRLPSADLIRGFVA